MMSDTLRNQIASASPDQLRAGLLAVMTWCDELQVDIEGHPSFIGRAMASEIQNRIQVKLIQ
jgi:hypothetical protein